MVVYYTYKNISSKDFILNCIEQYCASKNIEVKKPMKILKNASGKPFVNIKSIKFNLTHSKGLTILVVSPYEVGIDAEKIREINYEPIKAKFGLDDDIASSKDFLTLWVLKEAQAKMFGVSVIDCFRLNFPTLNYLSLDIDKRFIIKIAVADKGKCVDDIIKI